MTKFNLNHFCDKVSHLWLHEHLILCMGLICMYNVKQFLKTDSTNYTVNIHFTFREQPCPFPIIDSLFYSIVCGEQDGMFSSSRY